MPVSQRDADLACQEEMLQGVSRTFALTIPQLPGPLREVVGNAYLLCRIADTIEDEPGIGASDKRYLAERFVEVVAGRLSAALFADELASRLTAGSLPAEHVLVSHTDAVIRLTHSFRDRQRSALERCVRTMSRGMSEFAQSASLDGLTDQAELDRYCYVVAGVVGELVTELFCDYSPSIEARRERLMSLSVSFGQGLQMTNILKDVWDDRLRAACWLPREVFARHGCTLAELDPGRTNPGFEAALAELIGVARRHLGNALDYTLLLPRDEVGIRRFCLWALGMAVLTLRKIFQNPGFASGQEVKISRSSVRATVALTSLTARQDRLLRSLFGQLTRSLPPEGEVSRPQPA